MDRVTVYQFVTGGIYCFTMFLTATYATTTTTVHDSLVYCQNEIFTAQCPQDQVIVIQNAMYGRMHFSKCVRKDYGYIGCGSNVIDIAHGFCSGRQTCEINVPNTLLDAAQSCPEDFKSYLEISYACVPIIRAERHLCSRSDYVEVTAPEGTLANVVTYDTTCGGHRAPWLIRAQPGQRINVTMWDFTLREAGNRENSEQCIAYAIFRELDQTGTYTLCQGQREGRVYTSTSHELQIIMLGPITGDIERRRHFLLRYQMIGCGNPVAPVHGWADRVGNSVTMGCNDNDLSWKLTCREGAWHGKTNNCTKSLSGASTWNKLPITYELSIGIVCLIAACIAVCILIVGLVMMKRRRYQAPVAKTVLRHTTYGGDPGYHPHPHPAMGGPVDYRKPAQTGPGQPYWATGGGGLRPDPYKTPSENEYASIQEAVSPNATEDFPPGSAAGFDVAMKHHAIPPYSDCELPGTHPPQGGANVFSSDVMCRNSPAGGVVTAVDPGVAGREYYLVDPDSEVMHVTPKH